jgi:hypothetical protein
MTNISTISFCPATAPSAESFWEWPVGWYVAARSDQLGRKPLGVDLFGRRLVCYRATSRHHADLSETSKMTYKRHRSPPIWLDLSIPWWRHRH